MKKWFIPLLLIMQVSNGQDLSRLTLSQANELAIANYPLSRQKDLVRQTEDITLDNLSKAFLPQLSVSGQATYQSDVTRVNIHLPGFEITPPAKDQYKALADISQLIYDGGAIKQQRVVQQLAADVETRKIEVELYKLRERINQLYLGILYIDEQLKQVDLVSQDIQNSIKRVEAQVKNGLAFKSNLNLLKAELLKTGQRGIELNASRKGMLQALSLFLNHELLENVALELPVVESPVLNSEIDRPEVKLFADEIKLLDRQNNLIRSKNLPRASLFFQGGYGRPGLNMLQNSFEVFYYGGIRLNWSLGGLYTQKNEKQLININQQSVNIQKETFLLNTHAQLRQQRTDIERLEKLISSDNEIIELRRSVKDAAKAQVDNGVITVSDYLKEMNAEDMARQSLITHQLQLLQAKINYQNISGKP